MKSTIFSQDVLAAAKNQLKQWPNLDIWANVYGRRIAPDALAGWLGLPQTAENIKNLTAAWHHTYCHGGDTHPMLRQARAAARRSIKQILEGKQELNQSSDMYTALCVIATLR